MYAYVVVRVSVCGSGVQSIYVYMCGWMCVCIRGGGRCVHVCVDGGASSPLEPGLIGTNGTKTDTQVQVLDVNAGSSVHPSWPRSYGSHVGRECLASWASKTWSKTRHVVLLYCHIGHTWWATQSSWL